jgi:hypothetical protein
MALTPEQIEEARIAVFKAHGADLIPEVATTLARAIEAEVRAQDTALIRQLVEALEGYRRNHNDGQPCDAERAGRARLEGKP